MDAYTDKVREQLKFDPRMRYMRLSVFVPSFKVDVLRYRNVSSPLMLWRLVINNSHVYRLYPKCVLAACGIVALGSLWMRHVETVVEHTPRLSTDDLDKDLMISNRKRELDDFNRKYGGETKPLKRTFTLL